MSKSSLTRIGIFYDGNYLHHVSNYYYYIHERKSRLSIKGIHEFVKKYLAEQNETNHQLCQIVDAHYFRGRLTAKEAKEKDGALFYDRLFDEILMNEGVTTHYLPIKYYGGIKQEKGIDVWLALEAYEMAFYKKFDVLVLIAGDGDYVPLIRKLNTLGTAVMVLSWDFEYTGEDGKPYYTRTSQYLLEEVSYPVPMHELINNRVRRNEAMVNNLFVPPAVIKEKIFKKPVYTPTNPNALADDDDDDDYYAASNLDKDVFISKVLTVKDGYGFIKNEPDNAFFHYTSLIDYDFNDLVVGDKVQFRLEITDEGKTVAKEIIVLNGQNKQVVYED